MNTYFPASEEISRVSNPQDWDAAKSQKMIEACREMAVFHGTYSPDLKHIYQREGFEPLSVEREEDLARIPMVGVSAMKSFLMTTLPQTDAVLRLTSSGTRGQKTQIWFDAASLGRVQGMLDVLWQQEGLVSRESTNYLNFIYDPDQAKDLGISFSVKNEQRFAPVAESYFTVRKNAAGTWEFQKEATLSQLRKYAVQGHPVRLLGIPSFIFELLQVLKEVGPIWLPPKSYVLTGGGWKAAEDKSVTRARFRELITQYLGIPDKNIRDGFGMAEHSAPYIECNLHRFHVPVYNRVYARDPVTLEVLPAGKTGLLEFMTPFNAMMPNLAILSTDLGYLESEACACGRASPTFTLVGRGGLTKHKGCAISAGEIVRRK